MIDEDDSVVEDTEEEAPLTGATTNGASSNGASSNGKGHAVAFNLGVNA